MANSGNTAVPAVSTAVGEAGPSSSSASPTSPVSPKESSLASRSSSVLTRRRSSASSSSSSSSQSSSNIARPSQLARDGKDPSPSRHSRSESSSATAVVVRRRPSSSSSSSAKRSSAAPRSSSADGDQGGFHPKLGRIREDQERERDSDQEARQRSPSRERGKDSRDRPRERSSRAARRLVTAEDVGIGSGHVYRRNARYRSSGQGTLLQRQLSSITNASLVSVLSSLTTTSGASSGSNKTVTQDSYDRSQSQSHRKRRRRRSSREERDAYSTSPHRHPSRRYERSVFDYMEGDGPVAGYHAAYVSGPAPNSWQQRPASGPGRMYFEGGSEMEHKPVAVRRGSAASMDRVNSDSGISMRDGTPEPMDKSSPVARHDSAIEQDDVKNVDVEEDDGDDSSSSSSSSDSGDEPVENSVLQYQVGPQEGDLRLREQVQEKEEQASEHILQSPQPRRYHSFTRPRYDVQPGLPGMPYYSDPYSVQHSYTFPPMPRPPINGAAMHPIHYQPYPHRGYASSRRESLVDASAADGASSTTLAGYELLAAKLSEHAATANSCGDAVDEGKITPLYRRFEFLNHRILLHLQDEIAEMEEELRRIDEAIAQQQQQQYQQHMRTQSSVDLEPAKPPPTTTTKDEPPPRPAPASRRNDARNGGELCERRTLLLGRVFTKLGQYNKAMAAYTGATAAALDMARSDEVQSYRAWMEEHAPIDKSEARFLSFKDDLVSLGSRPGKAKRKRREEEVRCEQGDDDKLWLLGDVEWLRRRATCGNVAAMLVVVTAVYTWLRVVGNAVF